MNQTSDKQKHKDAPLEKRIKSLLAELIGVEPEDVTLEDSLADDLHMGAAELTDFVLLLQENDMDIEAADLNLAELETVSDLVEAIASELEIT